MKCIKILNHISLTFVLISIPACDSISKDEALPTDRVGSQEIDPEIIKILDIDKRLALTTPRCLKHVKADRSDLIVTWGKNRKWTGIHSSAFRITQIDGGSDHGSILGYPLSHYNKDYSGPIFLSPVSVRWPDGSEALIYDSEVQGYDGEIGASVKYRGNGEPQIFGCLDCGGHKFRISVQYDYSSGAYIGLLDFPESAWQDYFTYIVVFGRCIECDKLHAIVDMES